MGMEKAGMIQRDTNFGDYIVMTLIPEPHTIIIISYINQQAAVEPERLMTLTNL